jgi:hypothetical protein
MPYRFFSIPTTHGEDAERELNTFLAQHKNVRVDKQFVPDGERSFWAVAVTYAADAKPMSGGTREIPADYKPKVNYEETLTPEQYVLFNELRDLRNRIAEQTKEFVGERIGEAKYAERVQSLLARLLWPEVKSRQLRTRMLEENRARVDW